MSHFFYQNPAAPKPDKISTGAVAAIFRGNKLLLDWRNDGDFWALVGGRMEVGESLEECIQREVMEETGLVLSKLQLLGVFSHPSRIIAFPDNGAVQSVTIAFAGEASTGELHLSAESRGMRFFAPEELAALPIVPTHRMIIPYVFRPHLWPVIE